MFLLVADHLKEVDFWYKSGLLGGGVAILGLAVSMILVSNPPGEELKRYARARRLVACSLIALSVMWFLQWTFDFRAGHKEYAAAVNFTIYIVMYALFSLGYGVLVKMDYITKRRILQNAGLVVLVSALSWGGALLSEQGHKQLGTVLLVLVACVTMFLYLHFTYTFYQYYRQSINNTNEYFADGVRQNMSWLWKSQAMYTLALVMCCFLATRSKGPVMVQVIAGLFFVIYIVASYLNFCINKTPMAPLKTLETLAIEDMNEDDIDQLEEKIGKWRAKGGPLAKNLSIGQAAEEIGTSSSMLASYVNGVMQKNFFEWVRDMRLKEAKRLLKENDLLSDEEIAEATGFDTVSSFLFHFEESTGKTPEDWKHKQQGLAKRIIP